MAIYKMLIPEEKKYVLVQADDSLLMVLFCLYLDPTFLSSSSSWMESSGTMTVVSSFIAKQKL